MTIIINGPGNNLPFPIANYPAYPAISNVPSNLGTNFFDLAPGAAYQKNRIEKLERIQFAHKH